MKRRVQLDAGPQRAKGVYHGNRMSYVRTARALVSAVAAGVNGAGIGARREAAFIRAAFLIKRTLCIPYASGAAIGHGVPHRAVAAFV